MTRLARNSRRFMTAQSTTAAAVVKLCRGPRAGAHGRSAETLGTGVIGTIVAAGLSWVIWAFLTVPRLAPRPG